MKWIPNYITIIRMIGTFILLFLVEPLSDLFLVIYTISGFTDCLDGFVARKWNLTSEIGAKLDSVADLLYYAVMLIKILPILLVAMPKIFWLFVAIVVILRIVSYTIAFENTHGLASLHTVLNKITGFVVFLIPYAILAGFTEKYCIFAVIMSAVSTVQELIIHLKRRIEILKD